MESVWGVEHGTEGNVSKAKNQNPAGRKFTAAAFPVWHGAIAGKKGKKLQSAGAEALGNVGGAALGSTAGRVAGALATRGNAIGAAVGGGVGSIGGGITGSLKANSYNVKRGKLKHL